MRFKWRWPFMWRDEWVSFVFVFSGYSIHFSVLNQYMRRFMHDLTEFGPDGRTLAEMKTFLDERVF